MSDLDARLRAIGELLPEPGEHATDDARAAMHRVRATAPWATGRRRSWYASRGPRTYLIAAALALAIGGGALAAAWSLADIPGFGRDPEQAFVVPRTDILPGGYERTRPPRITELPARPSLRFPAGVTYTQAIAAYYRARHRGEVLPPGAELAAPLPAGKVVLIEDGRVSLDPAAPLGYDPGTGLVTTLSGSPSSSPALARCEVLFGSSDPKSIPCRRGQSVRYVSEGVAGRWLPSQGVGAPARIVGSSQLSVLQRPRRTGDGLPRHALGSGTGLALGRPDLAHARLARVIDGARFYVVPVGRVAACLVVRGKGADVGATCSQLSALTSSGAIWMSSSTGGSRFRYAAVVGDGFDLATGSGGERAPIRENVFAMSLGANTHSITISGPAGSYRMTGLGNQLPPRTDPHTNIPAAALASRKRIVASVRLSNGRSQTIWEAPSRAGGRCAWSSTFAGCSPASTRVPVDIVTAGFSAGGPGVPVVLSGKFAPQVGVLVLRFSDDSSVRLIPHEGWILYEVPADHLTRARMPASLTTFDHEGVALATEPLHFAPIVRQRRPTP